MKNKIMDPYKKNHNKIIVKTVECPYSFADVDGTKIHWTQYFEKLLNEARSQGLVLLSHDVLKDEYVSNPYVSNGAPYKGVVISCVMQIV